MDNLRVLHHRHAVTALALIRHGGRPLLHSHSFCVRMSAVPFPLRRFTYRRTIRRQLPYPSYRHLNPIPLISLELACAPPSDDGYIELIHSMHNVATDRRET